MIRILVVDEHPAVRAGLSALLRAEPGLVPVGAVEDGPGVLAAIGRARPDIALVDYRLPGENGLILCHRLTTSCAAPPRVVLYSAHDPAELALPACLAGAHGVVSKAADVDELFDALRTVARGGRVLPVVSAWELEELRASLEPVELPILGMAINGVSTTEMADVLRLAEPDVRAHVRRIIALLSVPLDGRWASRKAAGSAHV
jgi:DNA-binding NarL/FixJ family response regulator